MTAQDELLATEPDWIARLPRESLEHKLRGALAELAEIEHRLGLALGYPVGGPDYPGGEGEPVTGDHTALTLAMEAEQRLRATSAPDRGCGQCYECLAPSWGEFETHMVVCPDCGNKRCPHATSHTRDCTGSNEPGQPGSQYHPDYRAPWETNEVPATAAAPAPGHRVRVTYPSGRVEHSKVWPDGKYSGWGAVSVGSATVEVLRGHIATLHGLAGGKLTEDTTVTVTGPGLEASAPVPLRAGGRSSTSVFAAHRIAEALTSLGFELSEDERTGPVMQVVPIERARPAG
ncbi:hypothetical protein [Amycolatopsis thermophila]|uniref:Uncharacterized protein n=1 Tax=Amycolatopsis thermophila TaxID=206084 RepID=A0ABU0ENZ7_9PSEU|nr:hypothetical protein [Amycolatopsis thermophila]MDQ0376522.1 hypothetical protein [Amycolatopsis thermophila]